MSPVTPEDTISLGWKVFVRHKVCSLGQTDLVGQWSSESVVGQQLKLQRNRLKS